ncbi:MAG: EF-hand domain-containing protein [Synechococcales cyanobacterium C42_A2020_086]|jgi:calmodulin|nr:EF-hand domain-containing protein [Synechococcales cyanobacterium M58_A2018_015]MBF2076529.1 EF-hand domain-containing protein [Synechococcales cyanobacterium C42_A2020_086]
MSFNSPEIKVPPEAEALVPPKKLDSIKQAFAEIDHNHDGKIDLDEYLDYLLARERDKLTKQFKALDKDGDGAINFEEFLVASYPSYSLLKRFQDFDSNRNGLLSIEEALQIADEFNFPISREWLERLITIDEAGKKRISYNEYLGAVTRFGFQ